nr:hypothetical protein RVX_2416 [Nitratidesulfovibrio sp. HK-II]
MRPPTRGGQRADTSRQLLSGPASFHGDATRRPRLHWGRRRRRRAYAEWPQRGPDVEGWRAADRHAQCNEPATAARGAETTGCGGRCGIAAPPARGRGRKNSGRWGGGYFMR